MARVSIILPTYDRLAFLQEAVASVIGQTFADWELIVVDDGSTDGTMNWLRSRDDPRIVALAQPHTGNAARARTAGIARATGEWIAFLDSDDVWLAGKLAAQMRALADHPDCRWSCTGVGFIDHDGRPRLQRGGAAYRAQSGWILEKLLDHDAAATLPTLVVARRLFDDAGGFDPSLRYQEDYDLALRLASRSEIIALASCDTLVREHAARGTASAPASELYRFKELAIGKATRAATSASVRGAATRARARQIVHRANALAAERGRMRALAALASVPRWAPFDPVAWRWALGAAARILAGVRRQA